MKQEITCDYCGSTFERESREIKRSQKNNRRNFCSRTCCGKANIINIPSDRRSMYDISSHSRNNIDKYTGFREHLRRAKTRAYDIEITLDDLIDIWNAQKGICPYSGISLIKPSSKGNCRVRTSSLDRIDSTRGYTKDNIQFVAMPINLMKNTLSHKETIDLCKTIATFWEKR
jgi:hypothetical protein